MTLCKTKYAIVVGIKKSPKANQAHVATSLYCLYASLQCAELGVSRDRSIAKTWLADWLGEGAKKVSTMLFVFYCA